MPKFLRLGQQDASVGEALSAHQPEFTLQKLYKGESREPSPQSCPLTYTGASIVSCMPTHHEHTTTTNNNNSKKNGSFRNHGLPKKLLDAGA